jgi:hypothetical protein
MLVSTLFPLCEMLYTYGFVIVGRRYQSSVLVGTSWFLILAVAAQIPLLFVILLSPGYGTEPLPWFFYVCNYWEELAGVAFGICLTMLGTRIGRGATLAGIAAVALNLCYAISSTPPLATELVLLTSTSLGVIVLAGTTLR